MEPVYPATVLFTITLLPLVVFHVPVAEHDPHGPTKPVYEQGSSVYPPLKLIVPPEVRVND